jgi:hypothetical protein
MSHTNRSLAVAYILLVVLPLLALVEVLKMGRTLAAPISVDGVWRMEIETGYFSALPCGNLLSSVTNAPVSISQSGKSLILTLNGGSKATANVFEGRIIKASFAPTDSSTQAGCSINRIITLTATFDPKSDPRTLNGTLSVDGCASCVPVEVRAVREPRGSSEGAH